MDEDEKRKGEELLRSTPWVIEEMHDLGEPKAFDHMFSKDSTLRSKHYVAGERSPFIYKGPSIRIKGRLLDTSFRYEEDQMVEGDMDELNVIGASCTYAVYAGHYSINGSYMLQGGAISTIFDYATACIGTVLFNRGSFALTKSVTTNFLRGANPVPGVFKVICEVVDVDLMKGTLTLKSTLTNDTITEGERPFAVSDCVMVDGPRRALFKRRRDGTAGKSNVSGGMKSSSTASAVKVKTIGVDVSSTASNSGSIRIPNNYDEDENMCKVTDAKL